MSSRRAWHFPVIAVVLLTVCACGRRYPVEQISRSDFGAYEVGLAAHRDEVAAAWYDTRDGNGEIYLRFVSPDGTPTSAELRLTNTAAQSYEPAVDSFGDGIAVAWYEKSDTGSLSAQLGLWQAGERFVWRRALFAGGEQSRNPVVRAQDDMLFAAWIERDANGREAVWGRWWNTRGAPMSSLLRLGPASPTTWNLNAAIGADGAAYVAYDTIAGTEVEEVFIARVNGGHSTLTRATADDGQRSKYPDLAIGPEGAALTWFDERDGNREVYLYVGPSPGIGGDIDGLARRVTRTPGSSIGAYVASQSDRYGLAWSDESDAGYDIYFQAFDFRGEPFSVPLRLTSAPTDSLIPAISVIDDGFVIAWNEVLRGPAGFHDKATRSEIMFSVIHQSVVQ